MKVGITVTCTLCGRMKKPIGRSVPFAVDYCDDECPGFGTPPYPWSLWPGETEEEFGYSVGSNGTKEYEYDGSNLP